ncbi:MAG: nodulation protein NfeD, partial [Bacteroidales bacterium]|nr:nodulation protein NfeD [Bacteroidales bacterium]
MVSRLIKILLILFTVNIHSLNATGNDKKIYVIEIKTSIDKGSFRILKKGLSEARELASDYVIIHLNTYGGAVDAADSIRTALLNCPVPTVAFIDN